MFEQGDENHAGGEDKERQIGQGFEIDFFPARPGEPGPDDHEDGEKDIEKKHVRTRQRVMVTW